MSKDKQFCRLCNIELHKDNAYPNRVKKCLQTACKECGHKESKRWRDKNREHEKQRSRDYYHKNRKHLRVVYERCRLRRKYGLTPEQIEEMKQKQGGLCIICKTHNAEVVDHCHSTGVVRGILCKQCNSLLGYAYDNTSILKEAIVYLELERG